MTLFTRSLMPIGTFIGRLVIVTLNISFVSVVIIVGRSFVIANRLIVGGFITSG